MAAIQYDFLQRIAACCCPGISLAPVEGELPLLARGEKRSHRQYSLFTRRFPLWNTKFREYIYIFHVAELNFDTLAQCHTLALDAGMARFNPATKHSYTHITAIILCDSAQTDAMDALVPFAKRAGSLLSPKAHLSYRLAAMDFATDEVACNQQGRKLRSPLKLLLPRYGR